MVGKDIKTSASYAAWVETEHTSNVLYDILYSEGCVFYARTTQPQTIMHLETESNVYGRTVNPYNRDLTPGGSSGGESALVGIRGSILVSNTSNDACGCKYETNKSHRALVAISEAVSGARQLMLASMVSSKSSNFTASLISV